MSERAKDASESPRIWPLLAVPVAGAPLAAYFMGLVPQTVFFGMMSVLVAAILHTTIVSIGTEVERRVA